MFTSVLTINSNGLSDSGSYCCIAAVIGSGVSNKMNCSALNVLGKLMLHVTMKYYSFIIATDITISGQHTNLTVGTTYNIDCTVSGLEDSEAIALWTMSTDLSSVQVSANTLTLQSVNSTLTGAVFTCSVNSSKLYSAGQKTITITVQGIPLQTSPNINC